ncbi:MAG: tRNA lysidine(34) synthetase TilS [Ginsengibacter sp.]
MMSLLNRFISNIHNENLFQKNDNLIIAVSGGVDSIVLCELCKQAGFNFKIAHCNFQLRGAESDRDEMFVQSLGNKLDTTVFFKKFDTEKHAEENKVSIQVAARDLRYNWFDELTATTDNRQPITDNQHQITNIQHSTFLLTAHHANDNIETVLMNFFKGTGIKGLRGILPKQGKIIRPLLFARKEELILFANENNLAFTEDTSNASDKYTRNYFRNKIIPLVQKVFPKAEENLLNNIERFRDIGVLYHHALDLHKKKLIEHKGNEVHIPVLKLLKIEPLYTIVYEIIKDYGFTSHQCNDVINLLKSGSGKFISSPSHKIIKNREWIIIVPHNNMEALNILINEDDQEIVFADGKLKIEKHMITNCQLSTDNSIAMLDAEIITFPLLLRKWKQGDYFYPLGMQKKKKLSRFFIDQKMSLNEKEKTWVIESNKKIFWIVGKRIDDRFKVKTSTINILRILFKEL